MKRPSPDNTNKAAWNAYLKFIGLPADPGPMVRGKKAATGGQPPWVAEKKRKRRRGKRAGQNNQKP